MDRYNLARANFDSSFSSKSASFTSNVQISLPPKPPLIPSYRAEDTELSVFDAKHYFDEGGKTQNTIKRPIVRDARRTTNSRDNKYIENWKRSHSFRTTPTSCSEASWNSRSGLLSNPPGSAALPITSSTVKRKGKSSSRNLFYRNCPCYGKKSVDVEEKCSSPVRFSMEKERRMVSNSVKISAGLSWPKELPGFSFRVAAKAKYGDEDVGSDTSSDLFELESFGANSVYRRRDSLEEYLKLGERECYAPSEVSVDWSVATAEPAFGRASIGPFSSIRSTDLSVE